MDFQEYLDNGKKQTLKEVKESAEFFKIWDAARSEQEEYEYPAPKFEVRTLSFYCPVCDTRLSYITARKAVEFSRYFMWWLYSCDHCGYQYARTSVDD